MRQCCAWKLQAQHFGSSCFFLCHHGKNYCGRICGQMVACIVPTIRWSNSAVSSSKLARSARDSAAPPSPHAFYNIHSNCQHAHRVAQLRSDRLMDGLLSQAIVTACQSIKRASPSKIVSSSKAVSSSKRVSSSKESFLVKKCLLLCWLSLYSLSSNYTRWQTHQSIHIRALSDVEKISLGHTMPQDMLERFPTAEMIPHDSAIFPGAAGRGRGLGDSRRIWRLNIIVSCLADLNLENGR